MMGGLLLLLVLVPFHKDGFELAVGGVLLLLFLWSLKVVIQKRISIVWSPVQWVLLVFLAVCLLQITPMPFGVHQGLNWTQSLARSLVSPTRWSIITLDRRSTVNAVVGLAAMIGYLWIALSLINTQKRLRLIVNWLIVVGFAIAILSVLNSFSSKNDPLLGGGWPLGFYFRDLEYPGFLEMVLPLPLALIFAGGARRDQSVLYGFAAVAIGVAVATAITSTSAIVLVLELVLMALLIAKQRTTQRETKPGRYDRVWTVVGIVAIVGSLVAGTIWTATRPVSYMISRDVTREMQGLSTLEGQPVRGASHTRLVIWKTTLHVIADYPLLGVGLGAFPTAYKGYDPAPGTVEMNAAHNDYLQVVSESGLVGGALLILFLILLTRLSKQGLMSRTALGRSVALGASVGCFGILIHSLADFYLQALSDALVFFALIALLLIVQRQEQLLDLSRQRFKG